VCRVGARGYGFGVSEELLRRAYAAFNARDLDAALALMHPEVDWPNAVEGGRVHGHREVRAYWEGQFETFDPQVEPERIVDENGRLVVAVHQVVRSPDGELLADQRVRHLYTLREGLIGRMEIDPYELEFEDTFDEPSLDLGRWIPYYLPQWSTRERSAASYEVGGGTLRLRIEEDQAPWCPELDGEVRVSSLQTGLFAGPLGSRVGQHRFSPDAVVREEQLNARLYTPQYGRIELRAKALDDPQSMVARWLIGYEDEPARSAEICVCEIFGRDVEADRAAIGMGVHPCGDTEIVDEFSAETVPIDVREFHAYAADWGPEQVAFSVDGIRVKTVRQSPAYPMQLMLGIYEFPEQGRARSADSYPKEFVVDYVRGYRPAA
jgi:ketosteroid isomerase-like protein